VYLTTTAPALSSPPAIPGTGPLIAVLYESGCRVGELLTLRVRHVKFDKNGARLIVDGKTEMRRLIIVASSPYLAAWLNVHPMRDDPDAVLWLGIGTANQDQPLDYPSVRKMIRETARRAGVRKAVNPHLFRHSRATYLAGHLTEAQRLYTCMTNAGASSSLNSLKMSFNRHTVCFSSRYVLYDT
jgi:integrase